MAHFGVLDWREDAEYASCQARAYSGLAMTKIIYQKGVHDSAGAALAMATGLSYDEVLDRFWGYVKAERTAGIVTIRSWLESLGFETKTVAGRVKPFAPMHIAKVMWQGPHFVTMNGEGKVFDPHPRYPGYYDHNRLDHPHFIKVFWVMGIWRAEGSAGAA